MGIGDMVGAGVGWSSVGAGVVGTGVGNDVVGTGVGNDVVGTGVGTGVGSQMQSSASSCALASLPSSDMPFPLVHASHAVLVL